MCPNQQPTSCLRTCPPFHTSCTPMIEKTHPHLLVWEELHTIVFFWTLSYLKSSKSSFLAMEFIPIIFRFTSAKLRTPSPPKHSSKPRSSHTAPPHPGHRQGTKDGKLKGAAVHSACKEPSSKTAFKMDKYSSGKQKTAS